MKFDIYKTLLTPCQEQAAEKKKAYHCLTERHMQAMWFEQKYFKNLCTSEGKKIKVISPGIWNTESGPDFLKAHILVEDQEYRGDIELHLHEESWFHHSHHNDERYNQVILHLSFWEPLEKSTSEPFLSAYLENTLTVPVSRIVQLIDLDLFPYKKFVGAGKCGQHHFKFLPKDEITSFFTSAAYWRLEKKKEYLQTRFLSKDLQLAGGLVMALGYKHNTEAFLTLFEYLLPFRDDTYESLLSIALGCCGFFDKAVPKHWMKSPYYQSLKIEWESKKSEVDHQAHLRLDHIRPYNHPVRRLTYLIKFLQQKNFESLWNSLWTLWEHYVEDSKQNLKASSKFYKHLMNLFPSFDDPYWNFHYTFESQPREQFLPLIGKDVKEGMIINTILPLLYHEIIQNGNLHHLKSFQIFYSSLNATETGKSKYLRHRFFGDSEKGAMLKSSQMQQGAYQLHKDFCIHFEASCEGCPFVERYSSAIPLS